ncbi:hypothetical protein BJX68DRAFT_74443 [Aspergillus pseudodeflectus]|uniref:Hydrophobin n=1 Tax=Aspergillus pseudodeflectus TaxID=176178 RepID=A0ABR4KHY1_9EURO
MFRGRLNVKLFSCPFLFWISDIISMAVSSVSRDETETIQIPESCRIDLVRLKQVRGDSREGGLEGLSLPCLTLVATGSHSVKAWGGCEILGCLNVTLVGQLQQRRQGVEPSTSPRHMAGSDSLSSRPKGGKKA